MAFTIKLKILLLLALLLLIPLSSGLVEGFKDGTKPTHLLHKDVTRMKTRKLLNMIGAVLDYDDAGANPKHDPKRRPGNGSSGKNP